MARSVLSVAVLALCLATVAVGRPFPTPAVVRRDAIELENPALAASSPLPAGEVKMGLASSRHRRIDRWIAGAEAILGGLAAAIIVSVVSYIRITRKRAGEIEA